MFDEISAQWLRGAAGYDVFGMGDIVPCPAFQCHRVENVDKFRAKGLKKRGKVTMYYFTLLQATPQREQ